MLSFRGSGEGTNPPRRRLALTSHFTVQLMQKLSRTARKRSAIRHYAGFVIGAVVALSLLGGIVIASKHLPGLTESTERLEPTTTGSAPKNPAFTEPLNPPAYPAPAR